MSVRCQVHRLSTVRRPAWASSIASVTAARFAATHAAADGAPLSSASLDVQSSAVDKLRRRFDLVKSSFEYLQNRDPVTRMAAMADRAAKTALFDGFAEVAKALGSGRRLEIVDVLAQGERSVDALAAAIDQSVANTSHHLQSLSRAGLVTTRRDGTRIIYALASDHVAELWSALREVAAQHIAGMDRLAESYLGNRDSLEAISRDELARRLRDGDLVVLDVRPVEEYEAGHIAGARSVPIAELRRHLKAIPKGAEVVAYCRGPYCVYADEAVRELSRRGYPARRLEDGYPEWKRAGQAVATDS
jgi:rhodanese-related sulfurtransferase/predicted transcriptional regulator